MDSTLARPRLFFSAPRRAQLPPLYCGAPERYVLLPRREHGTDAVEAASVLGPGDSASLDRDTDGAAGRPTHEAIAAQRADDMDLPTQAVDDPLAGDVEPSGGSIRVDRCRGKKVPAGIA
jgi:hypothetical protein